MSFLLESVEQDHYLAFIEYEKHAVYVPIVFSTQLVQTIPDQLHELGRHPVLRFEQEQSVLDFFLLLGIQRLHESFKISAVCNYSTFHVQRYGIMLYLCTVIQF